MMTYACLCLNQKEPAHKIITFFQCKDFSASSQEQLISFKYEYYYE